jgi:outer membrane protein
MKLNKLYSFALSAVLISPVSANADILSFSAGGGVWNTSPDGSFQATNDPGAVSVTDNLFWGSESQGYFFATLEHPVPIIPNVKLMYTKIEQSGSGNTTFTFDGLPFSGKVSNDFKIENLDLIAYYEVLDNVVSLDLGLDIRNMKIDYSIVNGSTASDSFDETVPLLYVLVGVSPLPDLLISGEVSYLKYSGSSISDMTAKISYTTDFFVGFEAGYRIQKYEFDDVSGYNADLTFDGMFAGAYVKF